jgi:hypothetical protein
MSDRPKSASAAVRRQSKSTAVGLGLDDKELLFRKDPQTFAVSADKLINKKKMHNAQTLSDRLRDMTRAASAEDRSLNPNIPATSPINELTNKVTLIGFESNVVIEAKSDSRRNSVSSLTGSIRRKSVDLRKVVNIAMDTQSDPIIGEISASDAKKIDAFHRLISRKTQVFEDPALLNQMKEKRLFKENKIVSELSNLQPGFLKAHRDEDDLLQSMDGLSNKNYLMKQGSFFQNVQKPAFKRDPKFSSHVIQVPR